MVATADGLFALLIGIDDYPASPLTGCVNDVLRIEQWLVDVAGVPRERITRLLARKGGAGDTKPTLATIRAAFAALATSIKPGERAFIYYSGHGAQELWDLPGARGAREAIVPVDAWPVGGGPRQLLWDFELNTLLAAIAATTPYVTCVLDSCHSAGATRWPTPFGAPGVLGDSAVRQVAIEGVDPPLPDGVRGSGGFAANAAHGGWAQIVACEASELAREANVGDAGERHGLLTRALLQALDTVPKERVHEVRWSELWYSILDRVGGWNPHQHPRLFEAWSRPVLGGPRAAGDRGIRVTQTSATEFVVHAGTVAGIDRGSQLAVYGATPEVFPPLDSAADRAARLALVEVTDARGASAKATAIGAAKPLEAGARARVIKDAVTLVVQFDAVDTLIAAVVGAADRMRAAHAGEVGDVWIARRDDGAYVLGDACYTTIDPGGARTLFAIEAASQQTVAAALEHYRRYCQPVKIARRCRDLDGQLELELLDCSDDSKLAALKAQRALQDPDLPIIGATSTSDGLPIVRAGQKFCVRVTNTSTTKLEVVSLLCCTSDGQVELWAEELVPALGRTTFWVKGVLGNPFVGWVPEGRAAGVERLVAIGTTVAGTSFEHLQLGRTFGAAASATDRFDGPPKPVEKWVGLVHEVLFEKPRPG